MNKALVDTDILSDVLKGKNASVTDHANAYRTHHGRFTVAAATVMEIVQGLCRVEAHSQLENFLQYLDNFEVLPMETSVAVLSGRIHGAMSRSGQQVGVNDVLIAATAIQNGLTLVTGNLRHYERIRDSGYPLTIENWRS